MQVQRSASPAWVRAVAGTCVAWCVFLLLAGANVKTRDGGLSIPDWPTMYYDVVPGMDSIRAMLGPAALRAEFVHRLIAAVMGLLTALLAVSVQLAVPRRGVRILAWSALGLVIVQGVLGGLGVLTMLGNPWPLLHSVTAQVFLCVLVALASALSPWWTAAGGRRLDADALRLMKLSIVTVALLFVQLVLGAAARHGIFAREVHAMFALLVAIAVVRLVLTAGADQPRELTLLRRPAALLGVLFAAQVGLGLWSYLIDAAGRRQHEHALHEIAIVNAHVVVGALILAAAFGLLLRTFRVYGMPTDERVRDEVLGGGAGDAAPEARAAAVHA